MADDDQLKNQFDLTKATKETAAAQREYQKAVQESVDDMGSLYDRLRGITSELKGQESPLQKIRKGYRSLSNDAEKLLLHEQGTSKLTAKELETLTKRVQRQKASLDQQRKEFKVRDDIAKELESQAQTAKELNVSNDDLIESMMGYLKTQEGLTEEQVALLLSKYDQNDIEGEILEKAIKFKEVQEKTEKDIAKTVQHFAVIKDVIASIPGLRKMAPAFQEAEKAATDAMAAGMDATEAKRLGAKKLGEGMKNMFKNPLFQLTALVAVFKKVLDLGFAVDKEVTEIGKAQGKSTTEARQFRSELYNASRNSGDLLVTTKNLLQSQSELSTAAGVTTGFTQQELKAQTALTKRVGMQAESAAKLANLARVSNTSSEDALDSVIQQTTQLKLQEGINIDNREVLKDVSQVNGQIAATLGNNPGKIAKAVIQVRKLGLSLEQARNIANGLLDFESSISNELEAEILLGKELNLERARSLALQGDYAGATAEVAKQAGNLSEFQRMNVIQQQALAAAVGMTVDDLANSLQQQENLSKLGAQTKKDVLDRVEALKKEGKVQEANNLLNQAANEKDAKAALLKLDAQQQFTAAVEKAKDFFTGIANNLPVLVGILTSIAAVMAVIAVNSVMTALALSGGTAAVGIIAGLALLGLGAGALTSSMTGSGVGKTDMGSKKVNDAAISPDGGLLVSGPKGSIQLDKDDSIIAGTDLGGKPGSSGEVLRELRAIRVAIERGGNVYLDGSKVGEMLSLAQTKH